MTHREHLSKEEAQAFAERIAKLEAERDQALTRADATEAELRELRVEAETHRQIAYEAAAAAQCAPHDVAAVVRRLRQGFAMRPVHLFHVKDSERPMFVIAADWSEALEAWRALIASENDGVLGPSENPLGIDHLCSSDELLLTPAQIDQVVR